MYRYCIHTNILYSCMNLQKDALNETAFFKKPNTKIISRKRQTINSNLNGKKKFKSDSNQLLHLIGGGTTGAIFTTLVDFQMLIVLFPNLNFVTNNILHMLF